LFPTTWYVPTFEDVAAAAAPIGTVIARHDATPTAAAQRLKVDLIGLVPIVKWADGSGLSTPWLFVDYARKS
jgi:hypothetical protein